MPEFRYLSVFAIHPSFRAQYSPLPRDTELLVVSKPGSYLVTSTWLPWVYMCV